MNVNGTKEPVLERSLYRQIERPRLLLFTRLPDWQEDATETIVRFDLEEKGDKNFQEYVSILSF
jgi:hypothetical protein